MVWAWSFVVYRNRFRAAAGTFSAAVPILAGTFSYWRSVRLESFQSGLLPGWKAFRCRIAEPTGQFSSGG